MPDATQEAHLHVKPSESEYHTCQITAIWLRLDNRSSFPVQRLVKCEDGSGIVPPSLRRYKLHCGVDAGWVAGIEVNHFFPFSSTE